ncbi:MAG TPA: carboxylating nicotinate-nucleotide diphosphorylase [Syntrophales bacterium]|nr:carboxylating nicotinate-nucleotide diphosphorylase [Syntrophales bacterium]
MIPPYRLRQSIRRALEEDLEHGDITTTSCLTGGERGRATARAKSALVLAGIDVFREVFLCLDPFLSFAASRRDGQLVQPGEPLAEVQGNLSSILMAERVALNFLQRMSGIATLTRRYAEAVQGTGARIIDTRKTAPGLRIFDKYAVRTGGGANHRFGLSDGVLIKDNHITAAGGIRQAVQRARGAVPHTCRIEVEVTNFEELDEALAADAEIILLDNMGVAEMKKAVERVGGRRLLEASGGISLENVRAVAETGVNLISVGALTHSAPAADISLKISGDSGTGA